jgi:thiol:disulfide interchange protein
MPEIIENVKSMEDFKQLLVDNPGCLVLKFGAEWCLPCGKIKDAVEARFEEGHPHIQYVLVDVDESFEIYAYLKNKKMILGVPALLMYKRGNHAYVPDDVVFGTDMTKIGAFLDRCADEATRANA